MSESKKTLLDLFDSKDKTFSLANETMGFEDYLQLVMAKPAVARSAVQRVYDMIMHYGSEPSKKVGQENIPRYKFFDDPFDEDVKSGMFSGFGRDAIFGIEDALADLVATFKGAAEDRALSKRFFLMRGPVASAKSTIARLLKKGLQAYSFIDAGAVYTFNWVNVPRTERELEAGLNEPVVACPLREDPLKLIPEDQRFKIFKDINMNLPPVERISVKGTLCPPCHDFYEKLMHTYGGDWMEVLRKHILVRRMLFSETGRIGIGTFKPKDEKNQDSTELTGDTNFVTLPVYGDEANPHSFSHSGEFQYGNRGMVEFVEVLKLEMEFLYELLDATEDRVIKPKNQPNVFIDEVLIGHTNDPEYQKLVLNDRMEAFRNRVAMINVPYNLELSEEEKIYQKSFAPDRISKHIAPFTLRMASIWAILTRLEEPKKHEMTLIQKLKLYDGQVVERFGKEDIRELRKEAEREGFIGASPRIVQQALDYLLSRSVYKGNCVNPMNLFSELADIVHQHPSVKDKRERERFLQCIEHAKEEYSDIAQDELRKAICADETQMDALFKKYVDNVRSYTLKRKVKDLYTENEYEPDEKFMKSIESRMGLDSEAAKEHRTVLMTYLSEAYDDGRKYDYRNDARLFRAFQLELFESMKPRINLAEFAAVVKSKEGQEKLDIVRSRLIDGMGYCDECALKLINYASRLIQ